MTTPPVLSSEREKEIRERAERIVDAWEEAEGESMRAGHRETLVRLIVKELTPRHEHRFLTDEDGACWPCKCGKKAPR